MYDTGALRVRRLDVATAAADDDNDDDDGDDAAGATMPTMAVVNVQSYGGYEGAV